MSVVVSLLRAIDRADGEALVMHVGEKPYVVTATGHAELAAKALTIPAMTGMLEQLLPVDSRQALEEMGAVEYHLPPQPDSAPDARYSVVAARGGDDIWIEVRRKKAEAEPEPEPEPQPTPQIEVVRSAPAPIAVAAAEPATYTLETSGPIVVEDPAPVVIAATKPKPAIAVSSPPAVVHVPEPQPAPVMIAQQPEPPVMPAAPQDSAAEAPIVASEDLDVITFDEQQVFELENSMGAQIYPAAAPDVTTPEDEPSPFDLVADAHASVGVEEPAPAEQPDERDEPEVHTPHLAPVVSMPPRAVVRVETATAAAPQAHGEGLPHLLQVAAAQGASVLYVAVQAKPSLRVDGEIRVLDHETPLTEALLEQGLKAILPGGASVAVGKLETCDVPGVGRVQCHSFRDHRGLGAIFKMLPARAISSELMGLGASIQALCTETEGLVLVAGARGAGKSTLVAALVDQMNRTRRDHVITVEQQIQFVHENRHSFISQREARDDESFAAAVRAALGEDPDVLVIDQIASADAATFALNAAASGHLVIASITSPTTVAAVSRFMEFFGEERAQARLTLSEHLRGVITQNLLRKTGGGRAAAREVLVNVPSVATLIAEGELDQLASVLNGGRRVGMVPLNDALVALVQSGALDVREAYRKSPDQQELISQLNRVGLDTTFAERLA